MFFKVVYDDRTPEKKEEMMGVVFSAFRGNYVKVLVSAKSDPVFYDKFIEKIAAAGCADYKVHEEVVVVEDDQTTVQDVEDTGKLMDAYVDDMQLDFDPASLKGVLRELYVEAMAEQ